MAAFAPYTPVLPCTASYSTCMRAKTIVSVTP